MAYSRASLILLTVNFNKLKYWSSYLKTNYPQIYKKLDNIREQLFNLQIVQEQKQQYNYLISQINSDNDTLQDIINKLVQKHKLKFKYKWNYWGYYQSMQLFEYLSNTSTNWVLNKKTLKEIDDYFENNFEIEFLKLKCYEYGVDYVENEFD